MMFAVLQPQLMNSIVMVLDMLWAKLMEHFVIVPAVLRAKMTVLMVLDLLEAELMKANVMVPDGL